MYSSTHVYSVRTVQSIHSVVLRSSPPSGPFAFCGCIALCFDRSNAAVFQSKPDDYHISKMLNKLLLLIFCVTTMVIAIIASRSSIENLEGTALNDAINEESVRIIFIFCVVNFVVCLQILMNGLINLLSIELYLIDFPHSLSSAFLLFASTLILMLCIRNEGFPKLFASVHTIQL